MRLQLIFAGLFQLTHLILTSAKVIEDCTGDAQRLDGGGSYSETADCITKCYCAASPSNDMYVLSSSWKGPLTDVRRALQVSRQMRPESDKSFLVRYGVRV